MKRGGHAAGATAGRNVRVQQHGTELQVRPAPGCLPSHPGASAVAPAQQPCKGQARSGGRGEAGRVWHQLAGLRLCKSEVFRAHTTNVLPCSTKAEPAQCRHEPAHHSTRSPPPPPSAKGWKKATQPCRQGRRRLQRGAPQLQRRLPRRRRNSRPARCCRPRPPTLATGGRLRRTHHRATSTRTARTAASTRPTAASVSCMPGGHRGGRQHAVMDVHLSATGRGRRRQPSSLIPSCILEPLADSVACSSDAACHTRREARVLHQAGCGPAGRSSARAATGSTA